MTYEYICTFTETCGHKWTEEQKISEPATSCCPKCQRLSAKRLISGSGAFQLMGSGWAKDGYKK